MRIPFLMRMVFGIFCSFVLEKVRGLETIFGRDFSLTSRGCLVPYMFALAISLRWQTTNTSINSMLMKKFLLLFSSAVLALTSCSKQVDEPSVNTPEQNSTIHLNIEGEREDIPMVDASGRAINLTGNVANKKITSITLEFSEQVDGIVCIYNKEGKGFTRQVKFDVNGRKFVFKGNINLNGASKELLRDAKMDIYVGGDYIYEGDDKPVIYKPSIKPIPTQDKMNLTQFNPIFFSRGVPVSPGGSSSDVDFDSKGHRFRLFGHFVSLRFRNPRPGFNLNFNGIIVDAFANQGFQLKTPNQTSSSTAPTVGFKEGDNIGGLARPGIGIFYPFSDGRTITLNGPASEGQTSVPAGDPAYTVYIHTPAQWVGGFRFGKDAATGVSPFTSAHGSSYNYTNLQKSFDENERTGKFYNLFLTLQKRPLP